MCHRVHHVVHSKHVVLLPHQVFLRSCRFCFLSSYFFCLSFWCMYFAELCHFMAVVITIVVVVDAVFFLFSVSPNYNQTTIKYTYVKLHSSTYMVFRCVATVCAHKHKNLCEDNRFPLACCMHICLLLVCPKYERNISRIFTCIVRYSERQIEPIFD